MAGRYVILEFEDRDEANAFVMNDNFAKQLGFKATAMFLKPKKFCDCPGQAKNGSHNVDNWKKNSKYGLYICVRCKRPSKHHKSGMLSRLQYVFGFNILEKP